MDRGKRYTHEKEVKQILKLANQWTNLWEEAYMTRSPDDCTDHGVRMCIPQIITYKMIIRSSEMMHNMTAVRIQRAGKASCVILAYFSSCFWAGSTLLKKVSFFFIQMLLEVFPSPSFFFIKWRHAVCFACSFQNWIPETKAV